MRRHRRRGWDLPGTEGSANLCAACGYRCEEGEDSLSHPFLTPCPTCFTSSSSQPTSYHEFVAGTLDKDPARPNSGKNGWLPTQARQAGYEECVCVKRATRRRLSEGSGSAAGGELSELAAAGNSSPGAFMSMSMLTRNVAPRLLRSPLDSC